MAKNKSPGFRLPRIGADIFHHRVRRAAPDFGAAGLGDKFQRAFFHKNYFNKNVAVTTAVMVLSSEVVSFTPRRWCRLLCNGVI